MKRISVILGLALAILTNCSNPALKPSEARISGTMAPAVEGYLNVTAGPVLDSVRINKNGKFSITIPLAEPMQAMVFFNNRLASIYLEPGKEVMLTINSILFPENIVYGGDLGPVNHYIQLAGKLDQQNSVTPVELFSREPDGFIRFTDSIRQVKIQLLDEYESRYREIDPAYVSGTRAAIEFAWAMQRIEYPDKYYQIKGTLPDLPPGYHFDYLHRLNLNSPAFLNNNAYKEFLQKYLDYRQSVYLFEHPDTRSLIFPESVARFRVIHEDFQNQDILDYLLYIAMDDHLANFGTIRIESFLADFNISCKNEEYLKFIATRVTDLEKVGLDKPAPDFTAYTPDGKKVKLSDYSGQLLYIAFWASWSDWSIQEIPYFEQLCKDFKGKPVKFMMVSLDFEKDKNRWNEIIKKNNFKSIQLIQDSKSSVLKDSYFLNDFPRYFLIGADGKIISVFAPRPTENIAETITRILNRAG